MHDDRCECGKRFYPKQQARQVAVRMSKQQNDVVEAYKCPFVSTLWHVGHPGDRGGPLSREEKRADLQSPRGEDEPLRVIVRGGVFRFEITNRATLEAIRDGASARLAELGQ